MNKKRKQEVESVVPKQSRDAHWNNGILTICGTPVQLVVDHAVAQGWATRGRNVYPIDDKPLSSHNIKKNKMAKMKNVK